MELFKMAGAVEIRENNFLDKPENSFTANPAGFKENGAFFLVLFSMKYLLQREGSKYRLSPIVPNCPQLSPWYLFERH